MPFSIISNLSFNAREISRAQQFLNMYLFLDVAHGATTKIITVVHLPIWAISVLWRRREPQ